MTILNCKIYDLEFQRVITNSRPDKGLSHVGYYLCEVL